MTYTIINPPRSSKSFKQLGELRNGQVFRFFDDQADGYVCIFGYLGVGERGELDSINYYLFDRGDVCSVTRRYADHATDLVQVLDCEVVFNIKG